MREALNHTGFDGVYSSNFRFLTTVAERHLRDFMGPHWFVATVVTAPTIGDGGSRKVMFLKYLDLKSISEFLSIFPESFSNSSYQAPSQSDQKLGVGWGHGGAVTFSGKWFNYCV